MIRRISEFIIRVTLIFLVTFGYIFSPIGVNAQTTIKEGDTLAKLRQNLKDLQQEKASSVNEQKKTQSEIDASINSIAVANQEKEEAQNQITILSKEIDEVTSEIEELKNYTEDILVLYQKLESENIYISYVTGASTMTELIMRIDAINQITEQNEEKINSLELLIESNNKMSSELEKYQKTLSEKVVEYEAKVAALEGNLADLVEGAEDIDSEIQGLKELIEYYEKAGCEEDEDLTACVNIANNSGWTRPLTRGKITSPFGWRIHPTKGGWKFHNGIDIGGNSEGTKIYSSAAGIVGKITRKSSCGGNMVYIWVYVNGVPYTVVYMHLLKVYVNVGDAVTTSTVIGTVGGGAGTKSYDKCTTGAHLHYGVSENNHYLKSKSETYSKFTANMINPPNFPSYGSWFYSR